MAAGTALDYIPTFFIIPDFDRGEVSATLTTPKALGTVSWSIRDGRKVIASGRIGRPKGKVVFGAKLPDFKAWTPDTPHLYEVRLSFRWNREMIETSDLFGMRKFHVENKQIHLNNVPFYARGVIRGREAHDHPNLLGLDEEEYYAKYIREAKAFGFNFIRFHSRVPSEAYFHAADRLGILTHVEVRKYYGKYQKERKFMDHDPVLVKPRDWKSAIKRIRNHVSLMVYCLGNEINKPGRNPQVRDRAAEMRKLDPTRLFIDTCARGEYDRTGIDLDVQHMGYFAPFDHTHDMYNTSENWGIFGSATGRDMVTGGEGAKTVREVPVNFPILAHEVCHCAVLRDIDGLERKFRKCPDQKPWWIDELKKLRKQKGLESDWKTMLQASTHFQTIWHKQILESVRRSPLLGGFHMLQLADTELYENGNALLDCFDDRKEAMPTEYLPYNGNAVLVADLPRRTFFDAESFDVPVWFSNYDGSVGRDGTLSWTLKSKRGTAVNLKGKMTRLELAYELNKLATLKITLPKVRNPEPLTLTISLKPARGAAIKNNWNLWLFPNQPEKLAVKKATVGLADIDIKLRYRGLQVSTNLNKPEKLMIVDRFTAPVFSHLEKGGDVLMLYRVPETRDRSAKRESYYLPATQDRFKPVIWDRGTNLGGWFRKHKAVAGFPHEDWLDFQMWHLVNDADKISLDGFPVPVTPIIQGVDKACRDRYDVHTFGLRELQPDWTMRKFAYLFDLKVGRGRLMVAAMNFTGLESGAPEAACMFESLCACAINRTWTPKTKINANDLKAWLAAKGRAPRIKERMMTQYWQFDDAPLESAAYWKQAEEWCRKK